MSAHHPPEPAAGEIVERAVAEASEVIELALRFPERRQSRWRWNGLSRRGERWFNVIATAILVVFVSGWAWSLAEASSAAVDGERREGLSLPTARIAAALTSADAPTTAFLTEAALAAVDPGRGYSGALRATVRDPGEPLDVANVPEGADVGFTGSDGANGAEGGGAENATTPPDGAATAVAPDSVVVPEVPGVWKLVLRAGSALRPVSNFAVITRRPLSARRNGRVGLYFIGSWPTERSPREGYVTPSGLIEVTPENQDTRVSEHFRLRDFLTKGQADVWPKYLVLDMRLVDKLELVLADLRSQGVDVSGVRVMSGFRTPQYNATGGSTAGRASLSRHMYGDAADVYIDVDGDGWMDDINGDGRVDTGDARFMAAAAERVERKYPTLIGGIGIYSAGPGHGPFVHIDTRGYRARW